MQKTFYLFFSDWRLQLTIFIKQTYICSLFIYKKMGSSYSQNKSKHNQNKYKFHDKLINLSEWELVEPNQRIYNRDYGQYISYKHRISQEQIDKYCLHFEDEKQQKIYHQCYLQRLREEYIVNTIGYQQKNTKELCSRIYAADVYIEHIPVRFSEITDIPYPQNVYILKRALLGFQQLYDIIGFFQISQDHICIDKYGVAKVWMNADLSKNYPQQEQIQIEPESHMIEHLIKMVDQNTQEEYPLMRISQYFARKNRYPTFEQTLSILDQYIIEFNIQMPKYCESILQIFQNVNEDYLQDRTINNNNSNNKFSYSNASFSQNYLTPLDLRQTPKHDYRNTIKRSTVLNGQHLSNSNTERTMPNQHSLLPSRTDRSFSHSPGQFRAFKEPIQYPIQKKEPNIFRNFDMKASDISLSNSTLKYANANQYNGNPILNNHASEPKNSINIQKMQHSIATRHNGIKFTYQNQRNKVPIPNNKMNTDRNSYFPLPQRNYVTFGNGQSNSLHTNINYNQVVNISNQSNNKTYSYTDGVQTTQIDPEIMADLLKFN